MRQLWTQAAVIALTAGTLGAPAHAAGLAAQRFTPNFPITQPATPAPSEATPVPAGEAEALPAPTPIATQPAPAVSQAELPPPAQTAPPEPKPVLRPAPPKTVVTTTVTGPVVELQGKPQVRVVESGDALDAIARGMGSTRAELVKLNDLQPPYRLKLGQKIKGPATTAKAYVVQTGDTMFSIAKRFNVTAAALAEENDLKANSAIKKGQKLRLPDGYKDKGPIKTTQVIPAAPATTVAEAESAPATQRPASPTASRPARQTVSEEAPAPIATSTTTLSVTGSVVSVAGPRQIHTVKSGDTLTAIARKFDMSVSELAEANKLDTDKPLKLGAKIKGPATTQKAYVAQSGRYAVGGGQAVQRQRQRTGGGEQPARHGGDQEGPEARAAGRLQGQGADQDHHDDRRGGASHAPAREHSRKYLCTCRQQRAVSGRAGLAVEPHSLHR